MVERVAPSFATPVMPRSLPPRSERLAVLRPFLTGILIGFALLAVGGTRAQGIDNAPFDAALHAHVEDGNVSYPGFQDDPRFKAYVGTLAKPARLDTKNDRLAYYINAYNAFAIQGILDGLSPASLLGRTRYFRFQEWPLNDGKVSLQDIEHQVLRPLGEPRIHFAIICASKSCPFLRSEAYSAARLDAQLDEQARIFVNDRSRNRFDKAAKTAHLSEIFKWFDEDFRAAGSVQKYIARYVNDPEVARDLAQDAYQVAWIDYDWSLNGTPPRR